MVKKKTAIRKTPRNGADKSAPPAEGIRKAAFDLFARQGFPITTVRDIMHACGLTQGALYNHFSSKDELLASIIIHTQDELERELREALAAIGTDVVAQLHEYVRVHTLRHTRFRTEALVANREFGWLEPMKRSEVRASRRRVRDILIGILRRGEKEGAFKLVAADGRTDVKIAAMAILNMTTHVAQWFTSGGPFSDETVALMHAEMALRLAGARR